MKIPFSPPDITEAEIEQVAEALRSGWITTGPKTKELEREVADLCGTNRAVYIMNVLYVKLCKTIQIIRLLFFHKQYIILQMNWERRNTECRMAAYCQLL